LLLYIYENGRDPGIAITISLILPWQDKNIRVGQNFKSQRACVILFYAFPIRNSRVFVRPV